MTVIIPAWVFFMQKRNSIYAWSSSAIKKRSFGYKFLGFPCLAYELLNVQDLFKKDFL
ncbi:hypothetical protein [Picosynechococcus sp. PCC 11901]|uniref:hypothetical protein n=1 Tax=Picosynechococcus sp. PCC 11901 TaxID=2579791 RepID=UPI00143D782A|nr:hypothetical protein [Picosynechococcus sp. PCC 11901]